ncbi:MAG: class I SAM-dependent methyltransferase [Porticoccaceae bacterium]|jgi:predicted methyltransferase|nr:class I SAM-dependent methyltransferase [Porticoccaceae bacterium]
MIRSVFFSQGILLSCLILASFILVSCTGDGQDLAPESTSISDAAVDSSLVPSSSTDQSGVAVPVSGGETALIQIRVQSGFFAPGRPPEDLEANARRIPEQVIAWAGITESMEVIDIASAGGYYAENLAWAVGLDGWVIAQNTPAALERRDGANRIALEARLADRRLPQLETAELRFGQLAGSFDELQAAFMVNSIHDIYNFEGEAAAFEALDAIYNILGPSGFLVLIDHRGSANNDNADLHRIDPAVITPLLELAGFIITEESDLLANADDDLSISVFDESIRGNTDRFIIKAVKPAG